MINKGTCCNRCYQPKYMAAACSNPACDCHQTRAAVEGECGESMGPNATCIYPKSTCPRHTISDNGWDEIIDAHVGFDKDGMAHCSRAFLAEFLKKATNSAVNNGSLDIFQQGYAQGAAQAKREIVEDIEKWLWENGITHKQSAQALQRKLRSLTTPPNDK